jgi:cytoskeleton protein RodZ
MESVGTKLRHARQAQGRTLEQVNSGTRISVKILAAIEADDLSCFSSAFLYKSFARQFAENVKLDYSELASAVHATAERIPAPRIPGQGTTEAPKVAALPLGRKENSRLFYSITSFGVVLIACSGLYAVWQKSKVTLPLQWQHVIERVHLLDRSSAADPQDTRRAAMKTSQTVTEQGTVGGASAPVSQDEARSSQAQAGFTLELSATEPAWLSIIADGKPSFNGILEKAETKILEGHHTARIRTGNAGGVEVVFNGKPLGALGRRGQIRTVLFTKNNYEVLHSTGQVSRVEFIQNAELKLPFGPELSPVF